VVSPIPPKDVASFIDSEVAADIQIELQRLLSHPNFSASARRKGLLAYLVRQTPKAGARRLKESSIAVDVFGRNENFDPRADPVVRLEVHRLRHDLDEFYRGEGRDDPIRIMLPKGGYAATFERKNPGFGSQDSVEVEASSTPALNQGLPPPSAAGWAAVVSRSRPWLVVGCALIALSLTFWHAQTNRQPIVRSAIALGSRASAVNPGRGPIVALSAIRDMSPDPQRAYFADGLTEQLVSDLVRFENLRVISPGGVKTYDDGINTARNLRTQLGVDYMLRGSARLIDGTLRLALELVETNTDQVVWAETYC
jgi:adenylate cyclase